VAKRHIFKKNRYISSSYGKFVHLIQTPERPLYQKINLPKMKKIYHPENDHIRRLGK